MMDFKLWVEMRTFAGYGGPAFKWQDYEDDFRANQYHLHRDLYDDVQLALSNLKRSIQMSWKVSPSDLLWFEDSLDPRKYTSGMTVESTWVDDYRGGTDNFRSLIEYLESVDGPFDPADLKDIDPSQMSCVKKIMWDFEFDNLKDDDYDLTWGPHAWHPEPGEWERCRRIALDHQEYPVTVLVNGKMVDGAHRLAVAVHQRRGSYPCLVGVPSSWFTARRRLS